jgi:hypothetical protein
MTQQDDHVDDNMSLWHCCMARRVVLFTREMFHLHLLHSPLPKPFTLLVVACRS